MSGKIIGWEIRIYTLPRPGIPPMPDQRIEYGNSPVRDRQSRLAMISELLKEGRDFEVKPIREENETDKAA